MVKIIKKFLKNKNAQTAIELAVFGSILIFVIGGIINQTFNFGYEQNHNLKTLRQALFLSARTGRGDFPGRGILSRAPASLLIIEDRLSTGSGKFGAVDRIPKMSMATAMHSRDLFYPVDEDEEDANLPVMDVIINGKHFVFTTSAYKKICYLPDDSQCGNGDINNPCGDPSNYDECYDINWDKRCATRTEIVILSNCVPFDCDPSCPNILSNCNTPLLDPNQKPKTIIVTPVGCPAFRTILSNPGSNLDLEDRWCSENCPSKNLSDDERFDLCNGGLPPGTLDCSSGAVPAMTVPNDPDFRTVFAWQWYRIMGFITGQSIPGFSLRRFPSQPGNPNEPYTPADYADYQSRCNDEFGESQGPVVEGVDSGTAANFIADVDADGREEIIKRILYSEPSGVIRRIYVMETESGDLNTGINTLELLNGKNPSGLSPDVRMRTIVDADLSDGRRTALIIEDGALFNAYDNDPRPYHRSTLTKDHIDVVERYINLSNNTERFCHEDGTVDSHEGSISAPKYNIGGWCDEVPNPVEVCCILGHCREAMGAGVSQIIGADSCMHQDVAGQTCFETSDSDGDSVLEHTIYVRSTILNRHGRKWYTRAETW